MLAVYYSTVRSEFTKAWKVYCGLKACCTIVKELHASYDVHLRWPRQAKDSMNPST